jgi:hypothetical protein
MSTKTCKACEQNLPFSSYYKAIGTTLTTLCKKCHNAKKCIHQKANPKPKKAVGFSKLDETIRIAILKDISDGMKYKPIAAKYKIGYMSLLRWRDKGLLV